MGFFSKVGTFFEKDVKHFVRDNEDIRTVAAAGASAVFPAYAPAIQLVETGITAGVGTNRKPPRQPGKTNPVRPGGSRLAANAFKLTQVLREKARIAASARAGEIDALATTLPGPGFVAPGTARALSVLPAGFLETIKNNALPIGLGAGALVLVFLLARR